MSSLCSLVGLSVLLFLLPLWAADQEELEAVEEDYSIGLYTLIQTVIVKFHGVNVMF